MKFLQFILLVVVGLLKWPYSTFGKEKGHQRPNVVIFLADDLGYGDLPFYGHPTSKTPNLSKLAKMSKVFTDFYVASPVCSPSRSVSL